MKIKAMAPRIILLSILITFFYLLEVSAQYNPTVAVNYSDKWCNAKPGEENGYNVWYNTHPVTGVPKHESVYYNDYTLNDKNQRVGDCTNFVSQCLIAGGLKQELYDYLQMWTAQQRADWGGKLFENNNHSPAPDPNNPEFGYDQGVTSGGEIGTIANVRNGKVRDFLRDYYHAQYWQGYVPFDKMEAGDVVIFLGSGDRHTTFVGAVTPNKDDLLLNYHSGPRWHWSLKDNFENAATYNSFHLVRTVPSLKKVTVSELNADGSVYRVIYKADRGVGGYPVLTDETASGSRDLRITLEFNESIQFVRYKDTNNQLGEEVKPPSMRV